MFGSFYFSSSSSRLLFSSSLLVLTLERPDPVTSIQAASIDARYAVVTWNAAAYTGNLPITCYQIQIKLSDGQQAGSSVSTGSQNQPQQLNSTTTSVTINRLKPYSTYELRIRAENSAGWSEWSNVFSFTTDQEGE